MRNRYYLLMVCCLLQWWQYLAVSPPGVDLEVREMEINSKMFRE